MPQPEVLFDDDYADESDTAQAFNDNARPPPAKPFRPGLDHEKELIKLLEKLAYRHDKWRVFSDFCEMAAIALSNKVDKAQAERREARYMQIVSGYTKEEINQFPIAFAHLVEAHEAEMGDVLGRVFHALELHNKYKGQFFSPDTICRMMAAMTVGDADDLKERIARRGFVTANEPAVGSGAMVLALARAIREAGVNYQEHLHVIAADIDPKCVHMAYIQFTLWHIPAVVVVGDSMRMTEHEHWYTLAHVAGGWDAKLRTARAIEKMKELLIATPTVEATAPTIIPRANAPASQFAEAQGDEPETTEPFTTGPQLTLF
jgi:hypothetical protein